MRKSPYLGEVLRIPLLPLNPPLGQLAVRMVKKRRGQKTLTGCQTREAIVLTAGRDGGDEEEYAASCAASHLLREHCTGRGKGVSIQPSANMTGDQTNSAGCEQCWKCPVHRSPRCIDLQRHWPSRAIIAPLRRGDVDNRCRSLPENDIVAVVSFHCTSLQGARRGVQRCNDSVPDAPVAAFLGEGGCETRCPNAIQSAAGR
jgi:hypothetical protein